MNPQGKAQAKPERAGRCFNRTILSAGCGGARDLPTEAVTRVQGQWCARHDLFFDGEPHPFKSTRHLRNLFLKGSPGHIK